MIIDIFRFTILTLIIHAKLYDTQNENYSFIKKAFDKSAKLKWECFSWRKIDSTPTDNKFVSGVRNRKSLIAFSQRLWRSKKKSYVIEGMVFNV